MNSAAKFRIERLRTEALRKEANAQVRVLKTLGHGALAAGKGAIHATEPVGKVIWHGAKAVGGGTDFGGAAVLAGGTLAAGATIPALAQQGKQTYDMLKDPRVARAVGGV